MVLDAGFGGGFNLYWQPPPPGSTNGALTGYRLRISPFGVSPPEWLYGEDPLDHFDIEISASSLSYSLESKYSYPFAGFAIELSALNADGIGPATLATLAPPGQQPSGRPQSVSADLHEVNPDAFPTYGTEATIAWAAPGGLWYPNVPVIGFEIVLTPINGFGSTIAPVISHMVPTTFQTGDEPTKSFSTVVTDLVPDTEYAVVVYTLGASGLRSAPSLDTSFFTGPSLPAIAPSNVSVSALSTSSLRVSWSKVDNDNPATNGDISGYRVLFEPTEEGGCTGVVCEPRHQCEEVSKCSFGQCIYRNKQDGVPCNDNNRLTHDDVCTDGACAGTATAVAHATGSQLEGNELYFDFRSYGSGFFPQLNEFWFPSWSSDDVYRYDITGRYVGTFANIGQSAIIYVVGEMDSMYYYLAAWNANRCEKRGPYPTSTQLVWSFSPSSGGRTAGVSTDADNAYCIQDNSQLIHVLDKTSGGAKRTIPITGLQIGTVHGFFAVVKDRFFYGTVSSTSIYRADLDTGSADGFSCSLATGLRNMVFTGQHICGGDNNYMQCFKVS